MKPQLIKDAPQDGSNVLLFYPDDMHNQTSGWIEGWWFEDVPGGDDSGWETIFGFIGEPTHFLPAPEKPVSET